MRIGSGIGRGCSVADDKKINGVIDEEDRVMGRPSNRERKPYNLGYQADGQGKERTRERSGSRL